MGNINLKLYSISNLITVNIAQKIKGVSNNEKTKKYKKILHCIVGATTIMDWSDSGRRVSFDKGQFVSRGYDYRLKISADIYDSDGDLVEDATSYSTIESF